MDNIKSEIKTSSTPKSKEYKSMNVILELYKRQGFMVKEREGFMLLSFKDSNKVNIIVRNDDSKSPLSYDSVKNHYELFYKMGTKIGCYQFRLICYEGFEAECAFFYQMNLALSGRDYLKSLQRVNHIELYAHNDISYTKLLEHLKTTNKACIIQPTGTGKSLVLASFINMNAESRFVVLAPSRFIIEEIKKHLIDYRRILFYTYTMLINLSVKDVKRLNPDFIIVDEFHRCGAEEWGTGVNMLINSYPEAKLIGTTATHIRYLDDKRNMADELFDGNIANHLTLSKALALNILPSPRYISALYRFNDEYLRVKKSISDSLSEDKKVLLERLNKIKLEFENTESIPNILQEHLTGEVQKIIVFCKDIKHLRKHKEMVLEWFMSIGYNNIHSYEVHSENELQNKNIFNDFERFHENRLDIMFSVNMLNEGIHVKGVNCIIMLRDTESPIIYYQQLGRCLVVGGEKPLIFDLVNNFANIRHRDIENEVKENFKYFEEIYNNKGIPYKEISFEIIDKVRDIKELLDDVEATANSLNVFIEKLQKFKKAFGHCMVHSTYEDKWLYYKYRYVKKIKDKLSDKIINTLDQMGFVWENSIDRMNVEDSNNLLIEKINEFKKEHGHCLVSSNYHDKWLYQKIGKIRTLYKNKMLDQNIVNKLNDIGFIWDVRENIVNKYILKLKEYKEKNGHCNIPSTYNDQWLYVK